MAATDGAYYVSMAACDIVATMWCTAYVSGCTALLLLQEGVFTVLIARRGFGVQM